MHFWKSLVLTNTAYLGVPSSMRLMPRHLYGKLVLLVSSIVIFGIFVYGWINFKTQSRHSRDVIEQKAVIMAKNLAISCTDYLLLNDYSSLEMFLIRFAEFPDISGIQVYDSKGRILSDIVHNPGAPPDVRFSSATLKIPDTVQASVRMGNNQMVILQPIVVGSAIGWVKVTYNLNAIAEMRKIIWGNSALAGIIGVAISFITLLIILRPPVRSIKRIADFARRLDEIKGEVIPVERSFVEVEQVAESLNYASQKLYSTEQDLLSEKNRYQMLHDIAVEINKNTEISEMLGMMVCFSRDMLKTEFAVLALYDELGGVEKLITSGIKTIQEKELLEGSILRFMQYSLAPMKISDAGSHPAFSDEFSESHPMIKNLLGFPLFSGKGRPIGSLYLANKFEGDFTDDDKTLLTAIAADAAIIIERGLSIEELERFKRIVDGAFDVITITDRDGNIVYVNHAFETVTGYKRADAIGRKPNILRSGLLDTGFYQRLWGNITHGLPWRGEFINRRMDGELFMTSAIIFPVVSTDGSITNFVAIQRDITEEKKLYEQLLRSQKMDAIGTLAGGIAHDFNNILTSVLGYAGLLKSHLSEDNKLFKYADTIEKSADMGANLSKKILSITRKEHLEFKPVNLNSVVMETVELLKRTIPKEIELDVRLEDGLPNIKADYSQIGQVILNLAINARDAMPDGGRLLIATSHVGGENGAANGLKPANGVNFIRLTVEDTGTGIPKDYQSKIFDPFFTTKDPGKGTGLGLYMVHSIVTNHSGYINLYSEPNMGTRFNVYFSAYLATSEDVKEEEDILEGRGETVVVIDDEVYICELYTDVLTMAGYKVLKATEPREGVKIFKENPEIDVVILDLIMPHMSGREVFQILLQLNPEVRIILSSGYSAELYGDINKLITSGAKAFMQKPVSPKTLLTTISKVLRQ